MIDFFLKNEKNRAKIDLDLHTWNSSWRHISWSSIAATAEHDFLHVEAAALPDFHEAAVPGKAAEVSCALDEITEVDHHASAMKVSRMIYAKGPDEDVHEAGFVDRVKSECLAWLVHAKGV